jgi:septation ring formation regulator EzrA
VMKKVLKKKTGGRGDEEIRALEGGIRRMKRETERSVNAHFIDYRENVKFQYMLRLSEASSNRLYEGLTDHFRVYLSDLNGLIDSMGSESEGKEELRASLEAVEHQLLQLQSQVDSLRRNVDLLRGEDPAAGERQPAATGGL